MIFNEIYSAYYNAVAEIISLIIDGNGDKKSLMNAVEKHAFSESVLTVLPSLKSGKWQLVTPEFTTPVKNKPTMGMTLLQKRWLKAVSLDERVKLFDADFSWLEDIEPLFTPDDIVIYDKYSDGDPYTDASYIKNFRMILESVRAKQPLTVNMVNRHGKVISLNLLPYKLEYSEKDDKFRVIGANHKYPVTVNLGKIIECRKISGIISDGEYLPEKSTFTLRINDDRNALERCMLHFAHFEKRAEKLDDKHYDLHITYNTEDETELVIRVLGFGQMVKVTGPDHFKQLIIDRLIKQKDCGL